MEELLPLLIFVAWFVLSLLGRLARKLDKKKGTAEGSQPSTPSTFEKTMRDLMREAGLAEDPVVVERPMASERPTVSEHRPTPSEHRRTASEHAQTYGEHRRTVSEHLPTATEARRTASEHLRTASEHLLTPGEHLRGDVRLPPIPEFLAPVPTSKRHGGKQRRSSFAGAVVGDLKGGRSLARAVVLREILGPPVGLRSPDEGRS